MNRSLRYAVLVPLSVIAFLVLFVLPDVRLGWPGSLAVLLGAWTVWYLLWSTARAPAAAGDEAVAAMSPGEQRAWIGLVFTLAILVYFGLRAPRMVAPDGGMAPEAAAIARHIAMLVISWLVVMQVLRQYWRDRVEADERDRAIQARATDWARGGLVVFVIGLAVTFAFSPLERLAWAGPMTISNLLIAGLVGSCLLEYLVTGLAYWRGRH